MQGDSAKENKPGFPANQLYLHGFLSFFETAWDQPKQALGGEGGIRTPGTLTSTSHFECDAIDHSATSPHWSRAVHSAAFAFCQYLFAGLLTQKPKLLEAAPK